MTDQFTHASSDPNFDITVAASDDTVTLLLVGEVDIAVQRKLHEALIEAQEGARELIIDMSEVTFLDSAGINALVWAWRRAREGRVKVAGASGHVRQVLEITGLAGLVLESEV